MYVRVLDVTNKNNEYCFVILSRGGELLLVTSGYESSAGSRPLVKRLLNRYTKILGVSWDNNDIIIKLAGYSHATFISQIMGTKNAPVSTRIAAESEYQNGTILTIE
ncbi:MAG: hypothetical protein IJ688_06385 [Treponema sp.]|nr:hypothetical protein [Treponema sp.]